MRTHLHLLSSLAMIFLSTMVAQQPAEAQTQSSCAPFAVFSVVNGDYNVQNNAFNLPAGTQQCINVDTSTGAFTVTTNASVPTNGAPTAYPSIYRGCHFSNCTTNQGGLPIKISSITSAPTSFSVSTVPSGAYDVSYDIWIDNTSTFRNPHEVMIWINYLGPIQPAGSLVASNVSINGMTWNVWSDAKTQTFYVTTPVTSVNFDLLPFFQYLVNNRYIKASEFLIAVEAGFEIWQPGSGLSENSFTFSVM